MGKGKTRKGGPLSSEGVELLLKEDDESFQRRFPENPDLPSTGGEKKNDWGYPTIVVNLVREWTDALRGVEEHLQAAHGIHLVQFLKDAEKRALATHRRRHLLLSSLFQSTIIRASLAVLLLEIIRSFARRGGMQRLA